MKSWSTALNSKVKDGSWQKGQYTPQKIIINKIKQGLWYSSSLPVPAEFLLIGSTFFFWKLSTKFPPFWFSRASIFFQKLSTISSTAPEVLVALIHYRWASQEIPEVGTIDFMLTFSVPLLLTLLSSEKPKEKPGKDRSKSPIPSLVRWWNKQCWKSFLGMWRTSNSWWVLLGSTNDSNTLSVQTSISPQQLQGLDSKTGVQKNPPFLKSTSNQFPTLQSWT